MSNKIHALIPKIMAEVGSIEKDRKNAQQGYSFRGIDDVYSAFQGPLSRAGVFFVPEVIRMDREERQTQKGGTLIYTILTVKYTFFADDGSHVTATTIGEAMDSGDKSANKAMSAALKYALFQVFCIPTEEDSDTENHSPEVAPRGAAASRPQSLNALVKPKAEAEPFPMSKEERESIDREYGPPPVAAQPELREPGEDPEEDPSLFRVEFGKSAGKTLRQLGKQEVMNLRRFLEGAARFNPEKRARHIAACDQYLRKQGVLQTA